MAVNRLTVASSHWFAQLSIAPLEGSFLQRYTQMLWLHFYLFPVESTINYILDGASFLLFLELRVYICGKKI